MMHSGLCVHLLRDGKQYNGNWKAAIALKQERLWPLWPKQNPIVKIAQMMRIFGGSIVWQHGEKKKKGAVSSPDCYVFESPRLVCINMGGKKWRGKWKEMWLLHEGLWREEKKKKRRRTEQEEKRRGAQTQKNSFLSFRARGRQGVKCMEWHAGWDDSQFCCNARAESQTLTQSVCHHRLLMDTHYWIHTPPLCSLTVPHCRHMAFS